MKYIILVLFITSHTINLCCQSSKTVREKIEKLKKIESQYEAYMKNHNRLAKDTLTENLFSLNGLKVGLSLDSVRIQLGDPLEIKSNNTAFDESVWTWYYEDLIIGGFRNKVISVTSARNYYSSPNGLKTGLAVEELNTMLHLNINKNSSGIVAIFCDDCASYFHLVFTSGKVESVWLRYPE